MRGAAAFKRLLKRLPQDVRAELTVQLHLTGQEELAKAQALVPVRTGALKSALSMRVLPKSLKLKVGLVTKATSRRLFYGHIVEYGRLGQVVRAKRADSRPYILRVRGMRPRYFLHSTPAAQLKEPFRNIWQRALARAATGVGTDD